MSVLLFFIFLLYILQGVSVKGRFRCFSQLKWPLPPRQQVLNEGFFPAIPAGDETLLHNHLFTMGKSAS